jgi:predicted amidohydrolase
MKLAGALFLSVIRLKTKDGYNGESQHAHCLGADQSNGWGSGRKHRRIAAAARQAAGRGAEVAVFPELAVTGYPPRDLVEKPSFLDRSERAIEELARSTADLDLALVCGFVARSQAETGKRALNSAAVIERGEVVFRQSKMLLPTYDVFDEARYFGPPSAKRCACCAARMSP